MSRLLKIALIAEGPTDKILIDAAIKAILPDMQFDLRLQQPDATHPKCGQGWCGVFKWCRQWCVDNSNATIGLMSDPSFELFDMVILHIDADVATKKYSDCGRVPSNGYLELLPQNPKPEPDQAAMHMQNVLKSWLKIQSFDGKTVLCVPAQSSDTWLAAAVLPSTDADIESIDAVAKLENLPIKQRINKKQKEYEKYASTLTEEWSRVKSICQQAQYFETCFKNAVLAALDEPVA